MNPLIECGAQFMVSFATRVVAGVRTYNHYHSFCIAIVDGVKSFTSGRSDMLWQLRPRIFNEPNRIVAIATARLRLTFAVPLTFEKKWQKWIRDGKPEGKKPNKHRYVSGYHKGQELYGGFASRLNEPYVRESLDRYGIIVVEGMNDVMRMEELEVAAVGLTSNKPTTTQIESLVRFAQQAGNNRVTLLPDCDEEGERGFKEVLWRLAEHRTEIRLGCSRATFNGQFAERQPEDLTKEGWTVISDKSENPSR